MKTVDNLNTSRSVTLYTDNIYSDISRHEVSVDGFDIYPIDPSNTTTIWYTLTQDTIIANRAVVIIYNLNSGTCYQINATMYSDPLVEFWDYDFNTSALDTAYSSNFENGQLSNATGFSADETIILGDEFMSPSVDYAPEELVPGHTTDSLGIEVYTQGDNSYASIVTGAFPIVAGEKTIAEISVQENSAAGIKVYFNGKNYNRTTSTNFTTDTQFFLQGKSIVLPPQTTSGRAGYTIVRIGGIGLIDSNSVYVEGTSTVVVESLGSMKDIESVYVMANGVELPKVTTSTQFGYMIKENSYDNFRASVYCYNLPGTEQLVEAWFFNTPYMKFNRMNEEVFVATTTSQTAFTLSFPPGAWEPYSDKAIVELTSFPNNTRKRLMPPPVSNYTISPGKLDYYIDDLKKRYYATSQVFVYVNGVRIKPGLEFNYRIDLSNPNNFQIIDLVPGLFAVGSYLSIMYLPANEYDYFISGNILTLVNQSVNSIKVTTFNNHDSLFFKNERFAWNPAKFFKLANPVLDDNYVWVYVDGVPLIHRYEFMIEDDNRTIRILEELNIQGNPNVLVTHIKRPDYTDEIYGFRLFNDFFGRTHYKRLSKAHTTFTIQDTRYYDNSIKVFNENVLSPWNAARNIPGIVLLDRERIEFFATDNNELQSLRRGTLGTGPAFYVDSGAKVIDQGIIQTIPYADSVFVQSTITTTSSTYTISTSGSSIVGENGIILTQGIPFIDQLEVFYGGKPLMKSGMFYQESMGVYNGPWIQSTQTVSSASNLLTTTTIGTSYISTDTNKVWIYLDSKEEDAVKGYVYKGIKWRDPEFSINSLGSTQTITLNIQNVEPGVQLTLIQKKGYVWTMTESLLTSQSVQARFIRNFPAELPDWYFYGGDPRLLDGNYEPLEDGDGQSLRRY